jgi:hypothetical protein
MSFWRREEVFLQILLPWKMSLCLPPVPLLLFHRRQRLRLGLNLGCRQFLSRRRQHRRSLSSRHFLQFRAGRTYTGSSHRSSISHWTPESLLLRKVITWLPWRRISFEFSMVTQTAVLGWNTWSTFWNGTHLISQRNLDLDQKSLSLPYRTLKHHFKISWVRFR